MKPTPKTKYEFAKICSIAPERSASWQDVLFITIDLDWAADEIIDDTVNLLESAGVPATFFVTHDTPVLKRLRNNAQFEIGIHPNFNELLSGTSASGASAETIVSSLMQVVPEARSIRSHSTTQSSGLLDVFRRFGFTHDCNHFIPHISRIELKPYRLWNDLVKVPYFWEDDVDLLFLRTPDVSSLVTCHGLRVFNFHPIHIALNSTSMDTYERSRHAHRDWKRLRGLAAEGHGVRQAFENLLSMGRGNG